MRTTEPRFKPGTMVWFAGQCNPPLQGNARIRARVLDARWDPEVWMVVYTLLDCARNEVSHCNYESMVEARHE